MNIISLPDDFSPAFDDLIYTIDASGQDGIIDVEIIDDSETVLGIKRFRGGSTLEVNISPYAQQRLSPALISGGECRFVNAPGRIFRGGIRIGGIKSPVKVFTAGAKQCKPEFPLLSNLSLQRTLSTGEYDELPLAVCDTVLSSRITVSTSSGESFVMEIGDFHAGREIPVLIIDESHISDEAWARGYGEWQKAEVKIFGAGRTLATLEYELLRSRAKGSRLCWFNDLGGMDSYTFQSVVGTSIDVEKTSSITSEGYASRNATASRRFDITSGYLPQDVLNGLAGVLASPKVWRMEERQVFPVEVISDAATIKTGRLNRLDISIRDSRISSYQNF